MTNELKGDVSIGIKQKIYIKLKRKLSVIKSSRESIKYYISTKYGNNYQYDPYEDTSIVTGKGNKYANFEEDVFSVTVHTIRFSKEFMDSLKDFENRRDHVDDIINYIRNSLGLTEQYILLSKKTGYFDTRSVYNALIDNLYYSAQNVFYILNIKFNDLQYDTTCNGYKKPIISLSNNLSVYKVLYEASIKNMLDKYNMYCILKDNEYIDTQDEKICIRTLKFNDSSKISEASKKAMKCFLDTMFNGEFKNDLLDLNCDLDSLVKELSRLFVNQLIKDGMPKININLLHEEEETNEDIQSQNSN